MKLSDVRTRRSVLLGAGRGLVRTGIGGSAIAVATGVLIGGATPRSIEDDATGVLRPPGALDEPRFLAACLRCQLCAQACETDCITFAAPFQSQHSGTPRVVAALVACNLCLACTRACPSGALVEPIDREAVDMGFAVVDERLCVSHNGTGVCGACHTACPLRNRAITQGVHNAPSVHAEQCVGCGMCEEACIVDGLKAIRVFSGRAPS